MALEFNDLKKLALAAWKAEPNAPVAYSFTNEKGVAESYSAAQVNNVLRAEINELVPDYWSWMQNKNTVFRLISEVLDEVLPKKVEAQYMQFAEVKTISQGDKAVFKRRITEAARKRAKGFVTAVGLAGRYETFMLDGVEIEVKTGAIGAAARIGLEEFLDGRWQLSDFTEIILEGMDEYIYKEIAKALAAMVDNLPTVNKAVANKFDEKTMDELLAIADSYGSGAPSQIYCTFEFAATMKPDQAWASNGMKETLWTSGAFTTYKGHKIIIMPQSLEDETNQTKAIDPSMAYIIPAGSDKPIKLVFEGQTLLREVENNDDWSRDIQTYKKFGIATFANHWICSYKNTSLTMATRSDLSD